MFERITLLGPCPTSTAKTTAMPTFFHHSLHSLSPFAAASTASFLQRHMSRSSCCSFGSTKMLWIGLTLFSPSHSSCCIASEFFISWTLPASQKHKTQTSKTHSALHFLLLSHIMFSIVSSLFVLHNNWERAIYVSLKPHFTASCCLAIENVTSWKQLASQNHKTEGSKNPLCARLLFFLLLFFLLCLLGWACSFFCCGMFLSLVLCSHWQKSQFLVPFFLLVQCTRMSFTHSVFLLFCTGWGCLSTFACCFFCAAHVSIHPKLRFLAHRHC